MGRLAFVPTALALVGTTTVAGCALIAGLDFESVEGAGGAATGTPSAGGGGAGGDGAIGGGGEGGSATEPVFLVQLGGVQDDTGKGLAVLSNGDLAVTGDFAGVLKIGSERLSALSTPSMFVARLSIANGEGVWAHQIDSTENVEAAGVQQANNGDLVFAGDFVDTLSVPTNASLDVDYMNPSRQVFQLIANDSGVFSDLYALENAGNDVTYDVAVPSSGSGFYLAGTFNNALQLAEAGLTVATNPASDQDGFVAHRLANGTVPWVATLSGMSGAPDEIRAVSPLGPHLVIGGWILETSELLTGNASQELTYSGAQARAFYAVLNGADGTPMQATSFGGAGQQKLLDIAEVNGTSLVAVGTFKDTIEMPGTDGGMVSLSAEGEAGFVMRMTSDGEVVWSERLSGLTVSGQGGDEIASVALGEDIVVIGGRYRGADVALGSIALPPSDGVDGFVAGLRASDGEPLWAFDFGETGSDEIAQVIVDESHVIAIGTFANSVALGNALLTTEAVSGLDAFVVKFPLPPR